MKKLLAAIILTILTLNCWAVTLFDLKFSQYQIADSQWDVGACLYSNTCNIYYTNPGTMYTIPWWQGQWNWQPGQYVKFSASGITGYPYTAKVYNADGTLAGTVGSGKIINMGVDSTGHALFFFVGTDDDTGQLFSTNYGMSGNSGYSWTGTLNPTTTQVDSFASSYGSTTPLSAGQSFTANNSGTAPVAPAAPAYPAYVTIGSGTPGTMEFGSSNPPSAPQQTKIDIWTNKVIQDGNKIYIDQVYGDNNTVTMDQQGNKNLIRASLQGSSNNIIARQGVYGIGQNEIRIVQEGNNNNINLNQARDTQGNPLGGNGHYLAVEMGAWGTNLTVQQTNNGGVGGHYNETTIYGNGNNITEKQIDNGNKIMFVKIDGALNTVDVTQKGTGQHRLDATLTGDRNSATVLQEGTTANSATLNLTNAGGPSNVIVNQNGGQSVGVTTTCATAGGCAAITVRQGY